MGSGGLHIAKRAVRMQETNSERYRTFHLQMKPALRHLLKKYKNEKNASRGKIHDKNDFKPDNTIRLKSFKKIIPFKNALAWILDIHSF